MNGGCMRHAPGIFTETRLLAVTVSCFAVSCMCSSLLSGTGFQWSVLRWYFKTFATDIRGERVGEIMLSFASALPLPQVSPCLGASELACLLFTSWKCECAYKRNGHLHLCLLCLRFRVRRGQWCRAPSFGSCDEPPSGEAMTFIFLHPRR